MCGGEWSGSHIEDPEHGGSKNVHNAKPAARQQITCHSHIHTNAKQQQRTPLRIPSCGGSCTLDLQQQSLKHEHQVTVAPHDNCCRHAPAVPCPRPSGAAQHMQLMLHHHTVCQKNARSGRCSQRSAAYLPLANHHLLCNPPVGSLNGTHQYKIRHAVV